jgi:hypothetical protein
LTDRLSKINEALARKVQARNEYDKTIQETEAAYMKILESSQTLLHVLKVLFYVYRLIYSLLSCFILSLSLWTVVYSQRETVNLTKKKQTSS